MKGKVTFDTELERGNRLSYPIHCTLHIVHCTLKKRVLLK